MLNWHDWLHVAIGLIETISLLTKISVKIKFKLKTKKNEKEYQKFLEWKKKNNEK